MVERQVPPPVSEQADRVQSRPYDDFAGLPEEELRRDRLATRDMGVDNRIVWPPLVVTIGFLVAFATFVVQHWIPLVLGFVVMFVGGVMSVVSRRAGRGLGPIRINESR